MAKRLFKQFIHTLLKTISHLINVNASAFSASKLEIYYLTRKFVGDFFVKTREKLFPDTDYGLLGRAITDSLGIKGLRIRLIKKDYEFYGFCGLGDWEGILAITDSPGIKMITDFADLTDFGNWEGILAITDSLYIKGLRILQI